MIGAEVSGKLAKDLEAAAGIGDKEYVDAHHGEWEKEYEKVLDAIGKVVSVEDASDDSASDEEVLEFLPDEE